MFGNLTRAAMRGRFILASNEHLRRLLRAGLVGCDKLQQARGPRRTCWRPPLVRDISARMHR